MIIRKTCTAVSLSVITVCAGLCYAPYPTYAETSKVSFDNRLIDAVDQNNYEIVTALIQNGEDVNQTGKFNTNALQRAAYNGNIDLINLLLKSGANPNSVDFGGATALHIAARQGQPLVTKTLLQKGAKIDLPDDQGYTPLHRAVSNGKLIITQLLIQAGANINTVNNEGNSPLIDAVRTSNLSMVKELLIHGADKTIRNNKGQDVIDYAVKLKNHDIDVEVSKNYADIIAQNEVMRKTGFNDTTPAFLKQEINGNSFHTSHSDVASVPVARVDVEEITPASLKAAAAKTAPVKTADADFYRSQGLQLAPRIKEDEPAQLAEPQQPTPLNNLKVTAVTPDKSWIKTTGTPAETETALPKTMTISDSETPIKLIDIEHSNNSINLGNIEGNETRRNLPKPLPAKIEPAPRVEAPAIEPQRAAAIPPAAQPVAQPKIDKAYENEVDSLMNQFTSAPTPAPAVVSAPRLAPVPVPAIRTQPTPPPVINHPTEPQAQVQPSIPSPTQPVSAMQVSRAQQVFVNNAPAPQLQQPQLNTAPPAQNYPAMENSGGGLPDSLKFKDFITSRAPIQPQRQVSAPAIDKAYENNVDMLLNDYANSIQLDKPAPAKSYDKNYMNEVDSLLNQLTNSTPNEPLRSQQLVNQPIYQPPHDPKQGLYIPAQKLQKNVASIPFQNENGEFVTPARTQPAFQPVSRTANTFSPVVKSEPQSQNVNYNSYRSNLLKNVDEFYNNNSQENYGSLDMSDIERQREQNLSARKAADEQAIKLSTDIAPAKTHSEKVKAAPTIEIQSEDLENLPAPQENPEQ